MNQTKKTVLSVKSNKKKNVILGVQFEKKKKVASLLCLCRERRRFDLMSSAKEGPLRSDSNGFRPQVDDDCNAVVFSVSYSSLLFSFFSFFPSFLHLFWQVCCPFFMLCF